MVHFIIGIIGEDAENLASKIAEAYGFKEVEFNGGRFTKKPNGKSIAVLKDEDISYFKDNSNYRVVGIYIRKDASDEFKYNGPNCTYFLPKNHVSGTIDAILEDMKKSNYLN